MARDERAVLTVRICGLNAIAFGLHLLVGRLALVRSVLRQVWRTSGNWEAVRRGFGILAPSVVTIGVAVALILLAPLVSRLAAPRTPEVEDAGIRGSLRLAILVIGLLLASSFLATLTLLPTVSDPGVRVFLYLCVPAGAALFLLWPQPVVGLMQRRAAAGTDGGPRTVIAAGLAVAGLWLGIRALTQMGFILRLLGDPECPKGMVADYLVVGGIWLALAAAVFWWCGPIARRLSGEMPEEPSPAAVLPRSLCLCLAVFLIGFHEVLVPLARDVLWDIPAALSDAPRSISVAVMLGLKAALIVGAVWLIRLLGRWFGRRFYPGEAEPEGANARALVILQVGLILIALYAASGGMGLTFRLPGRIFPPLLAGVGLLAFWAEISRWLLRPGKLDEEALRKRRAAALRPWLVLLGFWIGVRPLASTLTWALGKVPGLLPPIEWPEDVIHVASRSEGPPLRWIAGLVLILAARPLARWFAYDSLFGRWWSLGWRTRRKAGPQ